MVKFASPTVVQRKQEAEFGKNALKTDCIIATFVKLVRSKIGSAQEDIQQLQRKRAMKFITLPKINNKTVAMACSSSRTTEH